MRILLLLFVLTGQVATAQFVNQKLGEHSSATAAPGASIAISPKNNKNMVAYAAGSIMFTIDGGATWNKSALDMTTGVAGNPEVVGDVKGNFFLFYSTDPGSKGSSEDTWLNQIVTRNSSDNGKTWSEPIIISDAPGKDQYNQFVAAHPKKEGLVVTWTQSGKYGSKVDSCRSDIMLSKSGSGKKWSKPIQVNQNSGNCLDEDFTLRGALPTIALDGKIFITWSSQGAALYDRSFDGEMWVTTDLAIIEQTGGWNLEMPGFGQIANTAVVAVDNSPSRIHGTLFFVYSDLKSGSTDSDVWLMRSVNRGDNWTTPARINQDEPGKEQFLPRISIDPANGVIYILYYDRRNYSDNQTDVYLAWSADGGNQFKEKKISEKPFTPDLGPGAKGSMTNYISLATQKGLVVPVWTAINNGKQEVWTTVIRQADLDK
jgi:hypothetical protein